MSNTQHTPGPWVADFESSTNCIDIVRPYMGSREIVAQVMNEDQSDSTDIDKANAALIAAAPDLLAALRLIARGEGFCGGTWVGELQSIARAAIAKAEGRA